MVPSKNERRLKERDQRKKPERPVKPGGGGGLLLALGGIGALLVLNMDTSVETSMGGRVNNIGLMNQQQNYLIVCVVIAIIGAVLLLRNRPDTPIDTKPPSEPPVAKSLADELVKLADLRDRGVLTEAEFAEQKATLLKRQ